MAQLKSDTVLQRNLKDMAMQLKQYQLLLIGHSNSLVQSALWLKQKSQMLHPKEY